MFKPSETKVVMPVEDADTESCACENVTHWLNNNEQYLRQPPAEHYIMTELYDRQFRTQTYYRPQPVPLLLPLKPVTMPCIRLSPMIPVYEKPLRKYYADSAEKNPGTSNSNQTFVQMESHGSSYYHDQNERSVRTQRQILTQQTQANEPVRETNAQSRNDTSFVNFF